MEKYIKDLSSLSVKDLYNYDWDIIELNVPINNKEMLDWYNIACSKK